MIRRTPRSTRTDTPLPYTTLFRSLGNVVAAASGPGLGETRLHALQHRLLGLDEVLRRLAEEHRARQRAVIAAVAAGDLEEGAFAGFQGAVVPGQVRRRGIRPRRPQRPAGGGVAAGRLGPPGAALQN